MKTPRTLKEYYADDKVIIKKVSSFMSLEVQPVQDLIKRGSFTRVVDDVIDNECFHRSKCERMTFGELLTLIHHSRTSENYCYMDSKYDVPVTSYEYYLYCAELLNVALYSARSMIPEVERLMKIPLQRLVSVLYKDNELRQRVMQMRLRRFYLAEKENDTPAYDEITLGKMIETANFSWKKIWIPTQMPIEIFKEKRERMCWANGLLMIELLSEAPDFCLDVNDIRQKYRLSPPVEIEADEAGEPDEYKTDTEADFETVKR